MIDSTAVPVEQLKAAIDTNDLDRVQRLMIADPSLHRAAMGYGGDGPLTWVAECRVPWGPPNAARLEMAEWMIQHGSDVHQGGDGPLMRAALNGVRVPMMELLVRHGADVNALWHGEYPVLFAACEGLNPRGLRWLLEHGAEANRGEEDGYGALDFLLECYSRDAARFRACVEALLEHGARTKYNDPAVLALLRGRLDELASMMDADAGLVRREFPNLTFGQTGGRLLLLTGATLLHVAAEFQDRDAVRMLLERGADVNARSSGYGQTAIFHAATQFDDGGAEIVELLLAHGADLSVSARLPGDYETPGESVEGTVCEYAARFGGPRTQAILKIGAK